MVLNKLALKKISEEELAKFGCKMIDKEKYFPFDYQ